MGERIEIHCLAFSTDCNKGLNQNWNEFSILIIGIFHWKIKGKLRNLGFGNMLNRLYVERELIKLDCHTGYTHC